MRALLVAPLLLAGCVASPQTWRGHQYLDGGDKAPRANPKNLPPVAAPPGDDWRQFGHDAQRTCVTKEKLDLPFIVAWTYTLEAPAQTLANAVAGAGYVHLHTLAEGNGQGTNSGFRNPWCVSLNGLTGEFRGTFTPAKDVSQGNWLAVYEDFNVVYHDDALGAYDCRTFNDRRWVGLDRWGPLAVDDQTKIVFHVNNLMADGDVPLIEAHKFSGSTMWRNNVWKVARLEGQIPVHEVNVASGLCIAAVRYSGKGANPPKDGIYAYEWQKGAQVWFVEGKYRNLVTGAKRVYALTDEGEVRAYDLRTGKEAWKAQLGVVVGTPGLWKDRLVALLQSGELVAMGAEEKDDGKVLWTVRVDGAVTNIGPAGASGGGESNKTGNDRTAMVMSDEGRALVCTKTGLALHDLADGRAIGKWEADDVTKALWKDGPINPIVARGTVYLCGKSAIVALWTSAFLRDQAAFVTKQAEAMGKAAQVSDAIRILRAIAATEGLKDAQKKKAEDAIATIAKGGDKEFAEVEKLKTKGHLNRARDTAEKIATEYAGTDLAKRASDEAAALAKQLEDPVIASDAGLKEAQALESSGKKKEAALAYKALAEKFPNTEAGKKAAEGYQKLKSFDK